MTLHLPSDYKKQNIQEKMESFVLRFRFEITIAKKNIYLVKKKTTISIPLYSFGAFTLCCGFCQ